MYKMKCISKDREGKPCNFSKVGDTKFCKFHQHMIDYTDEMLSQIKSCSTCRKMFYLGEYSTCEGCRSRGEKNRDTKRETNVKCFKEGCSYKKSKENKYCGKHQVEIFLDETKEEGMKPCPNYVRGCREKLNKDYGYSKCQMCLKVDRDKDHEKRGAAAEVPKENGMKTCSVCCKKQDDSEFIGIHGETKTCRDCRDAFKRADEKRDNEHVKELARENSQKPERKEVKKEWRENNKDKVEGYWIKNSCNYIRENNNDKFIEDNIKIAENENNGRYIDYVYRAVKENIDFKLSYDEFNVLTHKNCDYCGIIQDIGHNGIDRVDPKIGYTKENCVSCCKICNFMKGNKNVYSFLKIIEHIVSYNNLIENKKLYYEMFRDCPTTNYNQYTISSERRNIEFDITRQEYNEIIKASCYICGKSPSETHRNGLDRFDNKKWYHPDNVKSCCGTCNIIKSNNGHDDFINKCLKIYNHKIKENNIETQVIIENILPETTNEIIPELPQSSINEPKLQKNNKGLTDEEKKEKLKEQNRLKKQRQRERQRESMGDEAFRKMNADKMKAYRNK
jgi:hypothetical protein